MVIYLDETNAMQIRHWWVKSAITKIDLWDAHKNLNIVLYTHSYKIQDRIVPHDIA